MTGTPAIVVKLDDGTGTFPIDISSYTRLADGINWQRGRPDQYQDIGPGQMTLNVENIDGAFSFGGVGFGLGPFGSGPFGGGSINPGQYIRLSVAGQVRFTGRIVSTVVSWPGGGEEYAIITLTAVDDLARAALRKMRTAASEEILRDSPAAYYPLNEEQPDSGQVFIPTASDVTGNSQNPDLTLDFTTGISGTPVKFGDSLNIPDGSTGATFTGPGTLSHLTNKQHVTSWTSASSLHFDLVFYSASVADLNTGGGTSLLWFGLGTAPGAASLSVNSIGSVLFPAAGINYAAGLTSGVPHVISINSDAAATDLWIDGVKVATGTGISGDWNNGVTILGGLDGLLPMPALGSMTLGHFNFGPKLTDARVLAHQNALLFDFSGETPAARITRVAGYANIPVGTLDTTGSTLMGSSLQDGTSVLDAFNDVGNATRGIVWIGADGKVTNITGDSIIQATFPTAIHDANFVSADAQVETDMAEVINSATGQAAGSSNLTTALNQDSINTHGVYHQDYVWNVTSDTLARDLTNWQINTYPQPFPRVPTLKYDVQSMLLAGVLNALRLELGAFASVTGMPLQAPAGDLFLIVQGVSETISASDSGAEWSVTINGARHALTVAWILGDGFFGKLGASTKLYV